MAFANVRGLVSEQLNNLDNEQIAYLNHTGFVGG